MNLCTRNLFSRVHKAPIGSYVKMTPNACSMTYRAWEAIVPLLCDGIHAMLERINNHPDWWIVLSLDGFGSHLVGKLL